MTSLAPILESFFTDRLQRQLHASTHTVRAYRDTFRLLLGYAREHTGKQPCELDLADLDAALIAGFLDHLEHERHNTVRTRNARLAAIRSMFRHASYREPAHAALIQRVLAIPDKRAFHPVVSFLTPDEIDALLDAPDRTTWIGRRDHALLVTAVQTGLRVSELTGLRCHDVVLGTGAHVRCYGKGRKERCTPLTRHTVAVLRVWIAELGHIGDQPLFPGQEPTRPVSPKTLGQRLLRHGVNRAARVAALHHLIEHVPTPVLANLIGYNPNFVADRAATLNTAWANYPAIRQRTQATRT